MRLVVSPATPTASKARVVLRAAWVATKARCLGDDVDHAYYWDKGHATNEGPGDFIKWVAKVTGHKS
ncbi:hypothetical protein [Streptomyces sp. SudanB91_2054]|uniref:hypothetical protein n=1 Tax=Streptomyces sp. SudanB91_2054 TaxID=3035278 RepID=UPI0036DB132F